MGRLLTSIFAILLFLAALSACGQKGDLYHAGVKSTVLESAVNKA